VSLHHTVQIGTVAQPAPTPHAVGDGDPFKDSNEVGRKVDYTMPRFRMSGAKPPRCHLSFVASIRKLYYDVYHSLFVFNLALQCRMATLYGTVKHLGVQVLDSHKTHLKRFVCFDTTAPKGQGLLIHKVSISHTTTHHSR